MYQIRSRQIARLAQRAAPYIAKAQRIGKFWVHIQQGIVGHAAIFAFLVRDGNPRIGEPLSEAFARFATSKTWKACCARFPEAKKYGSQLHSGDAYVFEPYSRDDIYLIGNFLRHMLISTFPGRDEKEKLNQVFRSAPPWLIWFTFADYTAKLLGLDLPDISEVRRLPHGDRDGDQRDCRGSRRQGACELRTSASSVFPMMLA